MALRLTLERSFRRRMRFWRACCIGAVLLLLPLARVGLAVLMLRTQTIARYADCRSSKYGRLWECQCGDERNRLTEPLNERERRIWDDVVRKAREHRFVFRDPTPVRTNGEADMIDSPFGQIIYGETFPSGRVMLNSVQMEKMTDDEVALLMGHELGHQVDMQNERTGHPVLNRLAYSDPETVAWGVAAEIYGGEAVLRFQEKWQHRFSLD